ncbi:MAG: hypothetical protein CMJ87_04385 [Planctomycetes bacterium]|nr:hypothetical protein [Planctomycetota bacterium]
MAVSASPPTLPQQEEALASAAVAPERAAIQQEYRAKLQRWVRQQERLRGEPPSSHETKAQWAMFMVELIEREQASRPSSTQDQRSTAPAPSGDTVEPIGKVVGHVLDGMAARLESRSAAPSPAGVAP